MIDKMPVLSLSMMGHDSEFFLWDTSKDVVVPAHTYYKTQTDTKELRHSYLPWKKKYKIPDEETVLGYDAKGHYGTVIRRFYRTPPVVCSGMPAKVYRDGLAVEVGIHPVRCRGYMWNDTKQAMLKGEPPRLSNKIKFTSRPWVPITAKMIEGFPADLRELGCSPSWNAYTGKEGGLERVDPLTTYFRTSGSHLHMSFLEYNETKRMPPELAGQLALLTDLMIGVPFTYIFHDEFEKKRRELYGRAGEYRVQPYGGWEYRVLSSRLWNHPAVFSFFLGIWKHVLNGSNASLLWDAHDKSMGFTIRDAINNCDVKACGDLLPYIDKLMAKVIRNAGLYSIFGSGLILKYRSIMDAFREKNEAGEFKDCGIWNDPWYNEGHYGFLEHMNTWKLYSNQDFCATYGRGY